MIGLDEGLLLLASILISPPPQAINEAVNALMANNLCSFMKLFSFEVKVTFIDSARVVRVLQAIFDDLCEISATL